jgi:hypothetical protein
MIWVSCCNIPTVSEVTLNSKTEASELWKMACWLLSTTRKAGQRYVDTKLRYTIAYTPALFIVKCRFDDGWEEQAGAPSFLLPDREVVLLQSQKWSNSWSGAQEVRTKRSKMMIQRTKKKIREDVTYVAFRQTKTLEMVLTAETSRLQTSFHPYAL